MKNLCVRTKGYEHKKVIVDDDTYELYKNEHIYYSVTETSKTLRIYQGKHSGSIKLVSLILPYDFYRERIEYLNGDPFDLRRSNMRVVNRRADRLKVLPSVFGTTFRGVSKRRSGSYFVSTPIAGKTCYLTTCTDPIEAAKIYDAAVMFLCEDIQPYLNFPNEVGELSEKLKNKIRAHLVKAS